ncbi:low-density lipoprotein receptor class A domain-containing protein 3-like, partial [Branchiostoma floridae]
MECPTDLSGGCVPSGWICDDFQDCFDGKDEQGCAQGVPKHCFFTCRNNVTCLPSRQLGDGHQDCADGEDERPRHVEDALWHRWHTCNYNCLSVYGNASCVPAVFTCDGEADCLKEEDEEGCDVEDTVRRGCLTYFCPLPGQLDPICVPAHQICDGYPDCASGEDEQGCGYAEGVPTQPNITASVGPSTDGVGQELTGEPTRGQETQERPTAEPT